MIQFNCPNCKVTSEVDRIRRRETKPMPEPEYPISANPHFTLIGYYFNHIKYTADHWNRTIVCPTCKYVHQYWVD